MAETAARRERVARLLQAAQILADAERPEGRRLRRHLLETSGLSAPNIELGLTRCLEIAPSTQELESLLESTPEATRAHVLLSGNVFVAALRAVALGVASSPRVFVRASRRDPALIAALHALTPESFELTQTLSPCAGDRVWAYGSDETLADVRGSLPRGVHFHGHGTGVGAVVADGGTWGAGAARAVALDTALFDRRGCLSPHVVCVQGSLAEARVVAQTIARELDALEQELPAGPLSPVEQAERRRCRDAATYAFELFAAGAGWVSCGTTLVLPPPGRILHVVATAEAQRCLGPWSAQLTCIATSNVELSAQLRSTFPGARLCQLGEMQRPPLDGPVDRRLSPLGELLA